MSQPMLFSEEELSPWMREWQNMPEFVIEDLAPRFSIIVNFVCAGDVEDFGKMIGQKLAGNEKSRQMQSVWFPDQEIGRMVNKRYIDRGAR
jgi:hypothetical protein